MWRPSHHKIHGVHLNTLPIHNSLLGKYMISVLFTLVVMTEIVYKRNKSSSYFAVKFCSIVFTSLFIPKTEFILKVC